MITNTHGIEVTVNELRDEMAKWGIGVPFSLKRRDPREPGRKQKEESEDALFALFMRQFRKQTKGIRDMLKLVASDRKAITDRPVSFYFDYLDDDFWVDEDFIAEVARLFTKAAKQGIVLFESTIGLSMDYTLTNVEAAKWAAEYSYKLIKKIDKTTTKALQTIFKTFIDTPGMTIGDLVNMLPYTEARALNIAVTETTRIYATAERLAGEALQKEYPDVQVIQTWWTNQDPPRLCEVCEALHGKEVLLGELFDNQFEGPPDPHIGCRCWTTTTTRLKQ